MNPANAVKHIDGEQLLRSEVYYLRPVIIFFFIGKGVTVLLKEHEGTPGIICVFHKKP